MASESRFEWSVPLRLLRVRRQIPKRRLLKKRRRQLSRSGGKCCAGHLYRKLGSWHGGPCRAISLWLARAPDTALFDPSDPASHIEFAPTVVAIAKFTHNAGLRIPFQLAAR